jgi:hypothetical protein
MLSISGMHELRSAAIHFTLCFFACGRERERWACVVCGQVEAPQNFINVRLLLHFYHQEKKINWRAIKFFCLFVEII